MIFKKLENIVKNPGDFESVFAFSVHKCGSSLMYKMIADVCRRENIPFLDIPGRMFNSGYGPRWRTEKSTLKLIKPRGFVYTGYRDLPEIFQKREFLTSYRSVLLVRDPRDALVSQYFSLMPGGSHILPKNPERFIKSKSVDAGLSIDEYVIKHSTGHRFKLKNYLKFLDFSNVMVRRYEDIIFDKKQFLEDIFSHFKFSVDPSVVKEIAEKHDTIPTSEDTRKHIRKAVPGDHKEKLKRKTIEKLNIIMRDTSSLFGYTF